jgi:ribosomal protein S12
LAVGQVQPGVVFDSRRRVARVDVELERAVDDATGGDGDVVEEHRDEVLLADALLRGDVPGVIA